MNRDIQRQQIQDGEQTVLRAIPVLEEMFGEKFTLISGEYARIDLRSETWRIEVKGRAGGLVYSTTYPSTIFCVEKEAEMITQHKLGLKVGILFEFVDGFFFSQFNRRYATYDLRHLGYIARGEVKGLHYHIPIQDLIKLT